MAKGKKEKVYSKQQIFYSKRYADNKNSVAAVLEDGKQYTLKSADKLISAFMRGKVN